MTAILADHGYGKAGIRVGDVHRSGAEHRIRDLTVRTTLTGRFEDSYFTGDNSTVLPTDSQKNAVQAHAAGDFGDIEDLAAALTAYFVDSQDVVEGACVHIEERAWQAVDVDGKPAPDCFQAVPDLVRLARAERDAAGVRITSGLRGLRLFKSAGSEFHGFRRDRYTTLAEATDRVLVTEVQASWTRAGDPTDWAAAHREVRRHLTEAFAETHSLALQQTLFAMGERVIEHVRDVASIKLTLPNQHHIPIDLAPFGVAPAADVFTVLDEPYGVIEGTVTRGPDNRDLKDRT